MPEVGLERDSRPLKTQGSGENMRNPGQSDGCTGQSEVESVNTVHTPFCPRSIDPCPNDTAVRRAVIHRRRYRLAVQYESNPFTAAESGRRFS